MTEGRAPLWTCPKCGHQFVTRNLWHSCGNYALENHFFGKDPVVREVFDRYSGVIEACGPVTMYPQKTRIVFMVDVRFACAMTKQRWLEATLWLSEPMEHPSLQRVDKYGTAYIHTFRLREVADLDEAFIGLVRQSYAIGCREHLRLQTG